MEKVKTEIQMGCIIRMQGVYNSNSKFYLITQFDLIYRQCNQIGQPQQNQDSEEEYSGNNMIPRDTVMDTPHSQSETILQNGFEAQKVQIPSS